MHDTNLHPTQTPRKTRDVELEGEYRAMTLSVFVLGALPTVSPDHEVIIGRIAEAFVVLQSIRGTIVVSGTHRTQLEASKAAAIVANHMNNALNKRDAQ